MTDIFNPSVAQRARWRTQADRAATHMKSGRVKLNKPELKFGFVFDDGVVTVCLETKVIHEITHAALAEKIYNAVCDAVLVATEVKGNA